MEFFDLMLKRRSTRKFNDKHITKEELNKILTSALLAPSGRNLKPCNFIVVENRETLVKLSKSKDHGVEFVKNADKVIIVIANSLLSDTWCEDSSIVLTYMHLMASELDIGSCWVQIHLRTKDGKNSEEIIRDILQIDNYYRIVGMLALGHSDDIPSPRVLHELDKEKVHFLV